MVPPMFMDVQHDSYVLDMCAAPGSKTSQLMELMGAAALAAGQPVSMCALRAAGRRMLWWASVDRWWGRQQVASHASSCPGHLPHV